MKPDLAITSYTPGHFEECLAIVAAGWARAGIEFMGLPAISYDMPHPSNEAKITRLLTAASIPDPDTVVMLTDADMLCLKPDAFDFPETGDGIIAWGGDAYTGGKVPICYMIARAAVWSELVNGEAPECWRGTSMYDPKEDPYRYPFSDESLLRVLIKREHIPLTVIPRGWTDACRAHNRIDRGDWQWTQKSVEAGEYIDAHLPRPWSQYAENIKQLAVAAGIRKPPEGGEDDA